MADDSHTAAVHDPIDSHEHPVDGADEHPPPAAVARRGRTAHRVTYATAALAVVAVLVGVVAVVDRGGNRRHAAATVTAATITIGTAAPRTAAPGYRLESSLGMEVAVPDAWVVNPPECHPADLPMVLRGPTASLLMCSTLPSPTEEYAQLTFAADATETAAGTGLTATPTKLDGVSATRADGRLANGRYAGWIIVPSRNVAVIATTRRPETLAAILDGARLVTADHLGCPTDVPTARPDGGTTSTAVDPAPRAIDVCYYGGYLGRGRMQASTERTGTKAVQLATAINNAAPGGNPDVPNNCLDIGVPPIDALLIIHGATGDVHTMSARFSWCVRRGLDNGRELRHVTEDLITRIMDGMNVSYSWQSDLNG